MVLSCVSQVSCATMDSIRLSVLSALDPLCPDMKRIIMADVIGYWDHIESLHTRLAAATINRDNAVSALALANVNLAALHAERTMTLSLGG